MRELEENNIVPFEERAALHEAAQQRAKLQALGSQLASITDDTIESTWLIVRMWRSEPSWPHAAIGQTRLAS